MSSSNLNLNKDWFAISTAGAFGVVSGVVITDDALDSTARALRSNKSNHHAYPFDTIPHKTYEMIGPIVFLIGWVLVLFSACTQPNKNDPENSKIAYDPLWSTLTLISGILIIVFAMLSQTYMRKHNIEHSKGIENWKTIFSILFALSWYAFITFLSFREFPEENEKNTKFDVDKFIFGFIGASLIILGMMVLLKNRVVTSSIASVYNFGLPLFCFGWFFIIMQISLS